MKIIRLFLIVLPLSIALNSCYYDKEDALYPLSGYGNPCDSSATYTQAVKYILANNCTTCHSSSNSSGGVNLDNYNDASNVAKSGTLMGVIQNGTMPPGGAKVPDCQVTKLNDWINAQEPH